MLDRSRRVAAQASQDEGALGRAGAARVRAAGAALAGLMALFAAMPAQAGKPLWEAGFGLGAMRLPHYVGSGSSRNWLLPVPYFVYRGQILRADREGARAVLVDAERFDFDISLAATAPARSDRNPVREGMADLAPTLEVGPNMNLRLAEGRSRGIDWDLQLRLPVRAAFTLERDPKAIGWVSHPKLTLDGRWQGWNLGLNTGPVLATARYNAYFYGVTAADATGARPAYTARGGYGGWQTTAGVSRRFDRLWLGAFARHSHLGGASVAGSPLVERRSAMAYGLAMAWIFAESSTRVDIDE